MSRQYHYFNKPYTRPAPRNYLKETAVSFVAGFATTLASAIAIGFSLLFFVAFLTLVLAP